MCRILHEIKHTNTLVMKVNPSPLPPPPIFTPYNTFDHETEPTSSSFNKISPILLLVIITLALIFFISGLLHLLVRFLMKRRTFPSLYDSNRFPETSGSNHPLQRQLQQLFRLHDSGLDQASIEALPVFYYKDIMGIKEPFDCAVCLCEFSDLDKLRLLPSCSHAFHIQCIDTWLLSNSTCPLCRGILLSSRPPLENSTPNYQVPRQIEEGVSSSVVMEGSGGERRVFSVRLGKFRSLMYGGENSGKEGQELEETSCANLDGRRCYSMGTFQYVVGESNLQVALSNETVRSMRENGSLTVEGDMDGKRIKARCRRGESFSISKVWLWSKKSKVPTSSSSNFLDVSAASITVIRSPVHYRTETIVDV